MDKIKTNSKFSLGVDMSFDLSHIILFTLLISILFFEIENIKIIFQSLGIVITNIKLFIIVLLISWSKDVAFKTLLAFIIYKIIVY